MKWALMVDRGKRKGMIIPIQKSPFLIGRSDECQLRAANPYVSNRHCELLTEDDKFVVRDCNSTNGTFINSQRVDQVELHEGDCLKVGALAFLVRQEDLKPIEEQQPERTSPTLSRPVDEETVGDILLKLDEEDTGKPGPEPGAWKNTRTESTNSQPGPVKKQKADKSRPENDPNPSDVAKGLLKGQGALLKRRS
jgi:pSer/pThr/pTyr-binding forkhead associated (FHA) protein